LFCLLPRLGVVHDKLLSGLVDQAKAHAKDMSPQALANTLWSFAKMGYHPGNEAMSSMVNVAGEKIGRFNGESNMYGCMYVWMYVCMYGGMDGGMERDGTDRRICRC
jgi:hypothetical protein